MRRRGSCDDPGSLELLLDTVCNAFGGIMFIAILVAILSQHVVSGMSPNDRKDESDRPGEEEHDAEIVALNQKLETLQKIESEQQQTLSTLRGNIDENDLNDLRALQERISALSTERDNLQDALTNLATEIAEVERASQQTRDEIAARQAANERKPDRRELRAPRLTASAKRPVWMIVKGQRLYPLHPIDGGDLSTSWGSDVDGKATGEHVVVSPRQGQGQQIDNPEETSSYIAQILNTLDAKAYNLQFALYPDSYNAFIPLRDRLVKGGFEYNWYPMNEGDPLILSRGRPKVQ